MTRRGPRRIKVRVDGQMIKVDRVLYVTAHVLCAMDDLKKHGLLAGGCAVDRDKMSAIVDAAERVGWEAPTEAEIAIAIDGIQHSLR